MYNPTAFKVIKDFFITSTRRKESGIAAAAMLTNAAKRRYEELKESTKQELKRNWDRILEGSLVLRKRWDIQLDISAPQIIIPEHFRDQNATMIVLDFGKLVFCSAQPMSFKHKHSYEDGEHNSDDGAFKLYLI